MRILLAAVAVLALYGCKSDVGGECGKDDDCAVGLLCLKYKYCETRKWNSDFNRYQNIDEKSYGGVCGYPHVSGRILNTFACYSLSKLEEQARERGMSLDEYRKETKERFMKKPVRPFPFDK